MYLLTVNLAPWGSLSTAILTHGASKGGTTTVPPSCAALGDRAASSTAKVMLQCGGASSGELVARHRHEPSHRVLEALGRAVRRHATAQIGLAPREVVPVAGAAPHSEVGLAQVDRVGLPA